MATKDDAANNQQQPNGSAVSAIMAIDRLVHEPARLVILAILNGAEEVDFRFLSAASGLTKGNLSRQSSTLAEAGYITIRKYFRGRVPATGYQITDAGRAALSAYWSTLAALQKDTTVADSPPASGQTQPVSNS